MSSLIFSKIYKKKKSMSSAAVVLSTLWANTILGLFSLRYLPKEMFLFLF